MAVALYLLALQGAIGAFDTLYYHEWRARLPGIEKAAAPELRLHAARSILYAVLFGTLPWIAWQGGWCVALIAIIVAEIVLTLRDFVVEIDVRKKLGGVYAGELVTHAVMGIIYGAMLAHLIPVLLVWLREPAALAASAAPVAGWIRMTLSTMALGVFLSGLRDLYAALGLPHGSWPWNEASLDG